MSLFEIVKLENEYVNNLLTGKDLTNFPSTKLNKEIDKDIRAVIQSFTASIIFKALIG